MNYKCSTTPNIKNTNYKFKNNSNNKRNLKNQNTFQENIQIKSYKNIDLYKNPCYKSMDRNSCKNPINFKNLINNYNSFLLILLLMKIIRIIQKIIFG